MECNKSRLDLAKMLCLCSRLCVISFMVFVVSCDRDYSPGKRRSTTFQNAPYAVPVRQPVPVPVRQPVPVYQNPYQYQPYYYGTPNSRSYYNPYDFQQPYGGNPYSDYDQYYVPPTQYYNSEYDSGDSSTQ